MDGQFLPVLVLLLGASGLCGQGLGPRGPLEEPPEEKPPEEKPPEEEPPEEDGVLVLSRQTLGQALQEHPALLVEFYAPWCGHCRALAPEYSKAAALLAAESARVTLAKVDGPAEPELAEEFAVLQYFGLKAQEAPTLRFINIETTKKYAPEHGAPVTAATITDFCRTVLGGGVKPYHLSQEVPPDWDQRPVKTLVGKNFEQVAFDETKNVFIKFYAPWCAHCKEMAPAWEELAEKYRDHEDVIIAELDATANELEAFPVHGFPTLKYFPAGPGRKVIDYKGARDLETFSKFLDSGGELPAEEPAEVPGAAFPVGVCPQAPGLGPVLSRVAVGGHGQGWAEGVAPSWVSVILARKSQETPRNPRTRSQETPRSPGTSCSCPPSAPTQELCLGP
ncbi:PREDICTED: protein disulfide-isomerase A2 [Bison bison bison]|uniref:protein disulfide-isomerase n=1 Tax=Bison bison bison TaxID=43346 RepID=A0A6P3HLC1_BISBB|nr:PREDICTED: protein disulfide-isomerase A2 [Bison bison bison]